MSFILKRSELQRLDHEAITDIVLHTIGRTVPSATILKVGACDGVRDDLTRSRISAEVKIAGLDESC